MESQSKEKKRVSNIIWNASEDYSFQPDFEVYDGNGKANLYWNYIIGVVRKYYEYSRLQGFFVDLKVDPNHVFYESLTWLGLENCAFEKGRKERPVLEHLRRSYAEKVVRKEDPSSYYFLVDEIKLAHFQRVLGNKPNAREKVLNILNDLEFHESLETEQIIQRMTEIIKMYFPLSPDARKPRFFNNIFARNRKLYYEDNGPSHFPNPFRDTVLLNHFNTGYVDLSSTNSFFEETIEDWKKGKPLWQDLKDHWDRKQRAYIQHYYGSAIFPESQTKAIEQILCTENHKNCRLHFTRGEFGANVVTRLGENNHRNVIFNQRAKNKAYYQENRTRNSICIEKLTNIIRNAMLVALESANQRAKIGSLVAGKVWRNIYLNEDKVFVRKSIDEIGNLTVDILLDASGSQLDRQQIIANEGFIIAESLTRCQIPVKVYSFCTNRNFTIINLFRDYNEANKNEMIFHYFASGCNRDGLGIRAALHTMKEAAAEHKILIILSDGKPLDPQGLPGSGFHPDQYFYADAVGINDTAAEVRKGQREGTIILCVFTGAEKDFPAAKRIYGNNLVCINTPEIFADIVGVLIRNVLRSL